MRKLFPLLAFLLLLTATARAQCTRYNGRADAPGALVLTSGLNSTTRHVRSYPSATVTIYQPGTLTLVTLWSDSGCISSKSNPFTANTDSSYFFYTNGQGTVDIRYSGTGITTPFTIPSVLLFASSVATTTTLGTVKVSVAPADPASPVAVETGDPRISTATGSRECVANQMAGADLGAKIQACDAALGTSKGTIYVYGGGGLGAAQISLGILGAREVIFGAGTYTNTYQGGNPGTFTMYDNVSVRGVGNATIFNESTFDRGLNFSIYPWTVFSTHSSSVASGTNSNVTVRDLQIVGANPHFDSVSQTVSMGNCKKCLVENVTLTDTRTIGIQYGAQNGGGTTYAENSEVRNCHLAGVASQGIAITNCRYCAVRDNTITRPGNADLDAPGTTPIDVEPNSGDTLRNIEVVGNMIDAREVAINAFGSKMNNAVALQTAGASDAISILVKDNKVYGLRPTVSIPGYAGAYGILVRTSKDVTVEDNEIAYFQTCLSVDFSSDSIQVLSNKLTSCGFTTVSSMLIDGSTRVMVIDNVLTIDPLSFLVADEDKTIEEASATGALDGTNRFYLNNADVSASSGIAAANLPSTNIFPVRDVGVAFTDVTTGNASTSAHGYLPKLDNTVTHFLNGQGGFTTPTTLGAVAATSVAVGSGTAITKIVKGTVTIDPASINATTVSSQTFTLTGAVAGDSLVLNVPAAGLTAGMLVSQAFVSAGDTITIVFFNQTGAPIDLASASWTYTLIRS